MVEVRDGLLVAPEEPSRAVEMAKNTRMFENGARWFYWIAGLSVISHFQGGVSFVVGLGVTQVVDGITRVMVEDGVAAPGVIQVIALAISVFFAGIFALIGWLATQRQGWAFLAGMVLYALDGALFLLVSDWLSLGFHVFALVGIGKGYAALRTLRQAVPAAGQQTPEYGPGAS